MYNSSAAEKVFRGVVIDSRKSKPEELFIALRGTRTDGHRYIFNAIEHGAGGVIVERTYPRLHRIRGDIAIVTVRDTHEAMLKLAKHYRETVPATFIAITGSNGKTTTKELTAHLLRAVKSNVFHSPGNLNNLYGAPLALFAMPPDTAIAVMELGISTPGEMSRLAEIIRPDVIAITNVGPSHLEFLKSVEAVAQAKLELVTAAKDDVSVIVNADDDVLMREAKKVRPVLITFGISNKQADFAPSSIVPQNDGTTQVTIEGKAFSLPLPGKHQVYNLTAAYAVCRALGVSFDSIETQQISFASAPMRGEIVRKHGVTFFVDCYNANPDSMKAGLKAFFDLPHNGRRVLILGDMLELGEQGIYYHREIGKNLASYSFEHAFLVGTLSQAVRDAAVEAGIPARQLTHFPRTETAADEIPLLLKENDFVFLKASRGVGLEAILDAYEKKKETS